MRATLSRLPTFLLGIAILVALGAGLGSGVALIYWSASDHTVGVEATIRVLNDTSSLSSVLSSDQAQSWQDSGFISGEVSRLESDAFAQQLSTVLGRRVPALTVTQIATSDLVRLSTDDQNAGRGIVTLNAAIQFYREDRQASASRELKADLKATQQRLVALENATDRDSASTEVARLLAHESDLVAAQARLSEMVPVISPPAPTAAAGLGGQVLAPAIGGLLGALLTALGVAVVRLRDRSIRTPADLTSLGYRVLMPVFDLNLRSSWDYSARFLVGQLPSVHRGERLLLLAVDSTARADVIADVLLGDQDRMVGIRAMMVPDLCEPESGGSSPDQGGLPSDQDEPSPDQGGLPSDQGPGAVLTRPAEPEEKPRFEALDVRSMLTRRIDPSENAVLVASLGRSRRESVMGAFRAVNAAGISCAGVILTTGDTDSLTGAEPVRAVPWQHVR